MDPRAVVHLLDANIARQQQANAGLGRQRLVRKCRVAGPEDHVRPERDAEFLLEFLVDGNARDDAEALGCQRFGHSIDGLVEVTCQVHPDARHTHFRSPLADPLAREV